MMTAALFNKRYPVAPPGRVRVEVRLAKATNETLRTHTRSEAWELGDGHPVVKIEGKAGGYSLSAVRVLCDECDDTATHVVPSVFKQHGAPRVVCAFHVRVGARPLYPGACRVCGCTEEDCRACIAKTGAPCSWVLDRTLCSACVDVTERGPGWAYLKVHAPTAAGLEATGREVLRAYEELTGKELPPALRAADVLRTLGELATPTAKDVETVAKHQAKIRNAERTGDAKEHATLTGSLPDYLKKDAARRRLETALGDLDADRNLDELEALRAKVASLTDALHACEGDILAREEAVGDMSKKLEAALGGEAVLRRHLDASRGAVEELRAENADLAKRAVDASLALHEIVRTRLHVVAPALRGTALSDLGEEIRGIANRLVRAELVVHPVDQGDGTYEGRIVQRDVKPAKIPEGVKFFRPETIAAVDAVAKGELDRLKVVPENASGTFTDHAGVRPRSRTRPETPPKAEGGPSSASGAKFRLISRYERPKGAGGAGGGGQGTPAKGAPPARGKKSGKKRAGPKRAKP